VPWSGTTGRRAAVTAGAQITQICTHTGGTLTRQSAAPNGGSARVSQELG